MREDRWLSARLGTPAYTIEPEDDELPGGPAFVQSKVPCTDVARLGRLEDLGLRVVDVNLTLRRPAAPPPHAAEGVRPATEDDRDALVTIAGDDYRVSRFHLDPAIGEDTAAAVKRAWVDSFFAGERGDRMYVAEREGRVVGFHLAVRSGRDWVVDLIAVTRDARRARVGSSLLAALVEAEPAADVVAGTQVSNIAAIAMYERWGFRAEQSRYVLHGHQR